MRELHVHFCILDVCHWAALIVVLITYVWLYFTGEFREAITLAVGRIFRWNKKCWIGNNEENAFIERVKMLNLMEIRYVVIFYYVITLPVVTTELLTSPQFFNFYFHGRGRNLSHVSANYFIDSYRGFDWISCRMRWSEKVLYWFRSVNCDLWSG